MEYHNLIYLKQLRSDLRKRQTPAEEFLWEKIRNRKFLRKKFRRQHSFANYIFDFYCPEFQLVIEIDGSIHLTKEQNRYDKERDEIIAGFGFKILRFTNKQVFNEIEFVLEEIKKVLSSPGPSGVKKTSP